jgi:hypothetical protein
MYLSSVPRRATGLHKSVLPVSGSIKAPLYSRRAMRPASQQSCSATDPKNASSSGPDGDEDDFEGLTPEEDWEVGGSNLGSLSKNTELGRAVDAACDELEHLGHLENETLQQADDILKKFGFKPAVMQPTQEAGISKNDEGGNGQSKD